MECVLRIGGANMRAADVLALTALNPYRRDTAGVGGKRTNCLHFDVASTDDRAALITAAQGFLRRNEAFLRALDTIPAVEVRQLDFGFAMPESTVALSVTFPPGLLAAAGNLGIEVTASIYRSADEET